MPVCNGGHSSECSVPTLENYMHQWLTKLPITHLCHMKERHNSPSPGSQLSESEWVQMCLLLREYRCAFSPSSRVFCPQSVCCVHLNLSLHLCLHPFVSNVIHSDFYWPTQKAPHGEREEFYKGLGRWLPLIPTDPDISVYQPIAINVLSTFMVEFLEICFQHLSLLLAANGTHVLSGGGRGGVHIPAMCQPRLCNLITWRIQGK